MEKSNSETDSDEFISYSDKHAEYYDLIDESKKYSEECDFLEYAFKNYSKTQVGSVLDLGCGTGNHAKLLSARGYRVHGIDISGAMVEKAKSKNIPNADFIVGDMINFNVSEKVDACISLFAALGYVNKNKDLESAIKSVKNSLKEGGLFIFDCWNGLAVMSEKPSSRTRVIEKDGLQITRTSCPKLNASNHVCEVHFDIEIKKHGEVIEHWKEKHLMRFFFPQEIKKYLEDYGFKVIKICPALKPEEEASESNWWMSVIAMLEGESDKRESDMKTSRRKLAPVSVDERGEIWDLINETVSHVGILTCNKNSVRGNHYFKKSKRYAFVQSGRFELALAKSNSPENVEKIIIERGDLVEIPPEMIHTFIALEDSVLIGMDTMPRSEGGYEKDMVRVKIV